LYFFKVLGLKSNKREGKKKKRPINKCIM